MLEARAGLREYHEPEELLSALPGVRIEPLPGEGTRFHSRIASFALGEATLALIKASPALVMGEIAPAAVAIQVPLRGLDGFLINGREAQPGTLGLFGPGATLDRVSKAETDVAALLLPQASADHLLEPASGSPLGRPHGFGIHHGGTVAWRRLRRLAEALMQDRDGAEHHSPEAQRALRATVLEAFRCVLAPAGSAVPTPGQRDAPARQRIVRLADAYLRAHVDRPIYTEDLCAELHVSAAALAAAFHAVFGLSPHRFLKLRRLAMVRAALRAGGGGGPALVKSVALSHGFWHLGQFAHDYHAIYGEKPSETLAAGLAAGHHGGGTLRQSQESAA